MTKAILLVISLVFVACRVPPASQSEVLDVEGDCQSLANLPQDASGAQIFDVTSKCIFNRDIHTVHMRILSETFQKVLDDGCRGTKDGYGHVIELELNGKKINNVGIRVRGNTSRCNPKRQFKLVFDEDKLFSIFGGNRTDHDFPDNKDRTFYGLETLNLRASANDPSMIRERISSKIITKVNDAKPTTVRGAPVYRVAFTKVFVSFNRRADEGSEGTFRHLHDGHWYDYKGMYSLAENIDKVFLNTRYQQGDEKVKGHLIQSDLAKAWFDRDRYTREGFDPVYFKGKKVKDEDQRQDVDAAILKMIKKLDEAETESELEEILDVDSILNYMASIYFTGHWDSMLSNRNNDYLFWNPINKKWQIIIWDLDNSMGVIYDQYRAFLSTDIFAMGKKHQVKLFTKIIEPRFQRFRRKFKERLGAVEGQYYNDPGVITDIFNIGNTVKSAAEDWEGIQSNHFEDIKGFVLWRRDRLREQL